MRVFLTGGTGLLGSHVAEGLRGGGWEVVALHRGGADTRFLASVGCTLVEGDLTDPAEAHARRMAGCEGLVHAAAQLYGAASLDIARWINVEGTRRLLGGAAMAGIQRSAHVSSVAVYGNRRGPLTEEIPLLHPLEHGDRYGRSKREGEEVASGFHGRGGMAVTVLRPCALYGERDRRLLPQLARWLRRTVFPLPGGGESALPMAYAGNLAQAVERILQGSGGGDVFNLAGDVPLTLRSLGEGLARELGVRPRFIGAPRGLVHLGAWLGDQVGLRAPGAGDLSLVRAARLLMEGDPYPAGKARRVLGWDPPFSLGEAVSRSGRWIREREEQERGREK